MLKGIVEKKDLDDDLTEKIKALVADYKKTLDYLIKEDTEQFRPIASSE